jgi:hypothetical protein
MRASLLRAAPIALAAGLLAAPVLAQQQPSEETRQLGAHVHGAGKLGIALERRTLEIELEAPGHDIVGFEHTARTAEQKQAVTQARATLSKPLSLIKLPDAAACKVTATKVRLVSGHDHGHSHSHGKGTKGKEAEQHSEFRAEYTFSCAKPDALTTIDLGEYFKAFQRAEALDVTLVGVKGAAKQKATKEKPTVVIRGGG